MSTSTSPKLNQITKGDCIELLSQLPKESVDLVFADPPFNIGYDYDVYEDAKGYHEYLNWSRSWMSGVHQSLRPNGTFWLAIGDEYAAELKMVAQEIGFQCRSWVVWYYTFGVNCAHKFTRSHAHLFYFIKDPENFTFNSDDLDNRVPSARELVYNDKRANPKGRLPDDTWIIRPADVVGELVSDDDGTWSPSELAPPSDENRTFTLRPQDLDSCFKAEEDTWYFPRVAGTFHERKGFHGCQMPEQLLGRIVRACSNAGDVVVDPFSGSGTTLAVAKKLGRKYIGFEISSDYVKYASERLENCFIGDRLDGSPEPLKSAPKTETRNQSGKAQGKGSAKKRGQQERGEDRQKGYDEVQLELTLHGIVEAFRLSYDGFSVDRVVADPELNEQFASACRGIGIVGDRRTWNTLLFRLRKSGKLAGQPALKQTSVTWEDQDQYLFASEIAWRMLCEQQLDRSSRVISLDEILCDPALSREFDEIARRFAPGFSSFEYRWAALKLRKEANFARGRSEALLPPDLQDYQSLSEFDLDSVPNESGVYVLSGSLADQRLYVGETLNLRERMQMIIGQIDEWSKVSESLFIQTHPLENRSAGRLSWQTCLIRKKYESCPKLNYSKLFTRDDQ